MAENVALELEELIKRAQKQPGVVDVMRFYSQYNEILQKSGVYLGQTTQCAISSYSSSSS